MSDSKKRTTRKKLSKEAPMVEDNKLQEETLKEEQVFKALPRDLQWKILSKYLGTHVVRNGKLMRKMTGNVHLGLLNSMPQTMLGRKPKELILKSIMKMENKNTWFHAFDHEGKQGIRSLDVIEDSDGNPAYRYTSHLNGQDRVEILTPIEKGAVLQPYINNKSEYPSYPYTNKKLGRKTLKNPLHKPTKPNTGYNKPRL